MGRLDISDVRPWAEFVAIVAGAAFAVGAILVTTARLDASIDAFASVVSRLERVITGHETRLDELEQSEARSDERINGLEGYVERERARGIHP